MPRKLSRQQALKNSKKGYIPIYMPGSDGVTDIVLAKGRLKGGTLILEFESNLPGVAIQRMLGRGELLGMSFVMLEAEPAVETQDEKDARDLEILQSDEPITPEALDG